MRKSTLITLLLISIFLLTGCSQIQKIEDPIKASNRPSIKPVNIIASATATPEPLLIIRKPSITRSPMRVQLDVPDHVVVPKFYQLLDLTGVPHAVYAYTDKQNQIQYRVYADIDELEDGHITNTISGFFIAKVYLSEGNTFIIETDKDSDPVDISAEDPVTLVTCPAPTKANIRNAIKKKTNDQKKYKSDCDKASRVGEPTPTPPPWDGLPVLDESSTEITLPSKLKSAGSQNPNLYYYINLYGEREYRRYATPDGYDSGFYLSDENGSITDGSLKVDYTTDFDGTYFKQKKTLAPPASNLYRLPVFITLSNGLETSATVVYRKNIKE